MTRAEASRLNGAKSRGPATEEGKQRSSLNALRHGLTAAKDKAFVCQNEDQAWDSIYEDFVARFAPIGPVEHDLIAELTQARWRLRRSSTIETGVLDHEMDRQSASLETRYEQVDECSRISLAFEHIARNNRTIDVLSRYESPRPPRFRAHPHSTHPTPEHAPPAGLAKCNFAKRTRDDHRNPVFYPAVI